MKKVIKTNLLVFILLLLFVEVAGHVVFWIRWKHPLWSNPMEKYYRALYQPHPYLSVALRPNVHMLYEGDSDQVVTTTALGTRWTGGMPAPGKITVACLGGSTTFCNGVGDADSWPVLLQHKLGDRYAVVNFGMSGYTTTEAMVQMALTVPQVHPCIVVYYMGWNDLHTSYIPENFPDYFHHGSELAQNLLVGDASGTSCWQKLRGLSGLFYIADNVAERLHPPPSPVLHTTPDPALDTVYARNIRTLDVLARSLDAQPVFIGQVFNPHFEHTPGTSSPWTRYLDEGYVPALMDHLNGVARAAAAAADSGAVYLDFPHAAGWRAEYFIDAGHFTRAGNEVFSALLAKAIKAMGPGCGVKAD